MARFDLEIALPAGLTLEKNRKRLKDFKDIGLLNINHYKVKLVLLVVRNIVPEYYLTYGWPAGVTPVVQYCNYEHVVPKFCSYYFGLKEYESDWYMACDDDSVTDISCMMGHLKDIGAEREIYLSNGNLTPDSPIGIEKELLDSVELYQRIGRYS